MSPGRAAPKEDHPLHTPSRRDLVAMFTLVLLWSAAGFSVWLNVTTFGQMIIIVLVEATRGIFVGLLRPSGPDEYDDGPGGT